MRQNVVQILTRNGTMLRSKRIGHNLAEHLGLSRLSSTLPPTANHNSAPTKNQKTVRFRSDFSQFQYRFTLGSRRFFPTHSLPHPWMKTA